jgi:N-acetylglucosamine malate deacetylase 1
MLAKKIYRYIRNALIEKFRSIQASLLLRWTLKRSSKTLDVGNQSIIIFAPHQDDETLGCGGLIAFKRKQNLPTRVVFLSNGQGSHANYNQERMAQLIKQRQQEAIAALSILGVASSEIDFLGYPDGNLSHLSELEHHNLVQAIVTILNRYQPQAIYLPHALDGHADHEATYTLVKEAMALATPQTEIWQYLIWLFWERTLFFNLKLSQINDPYLLEISEVKNLKKEAIAAYSTQHEVLPSAFLKQFYLPYEIYYRA